jgi:hypothetical protein
VETTVLFKWAFVHRGWPFTLIDPIGTTFNNKKNHCLATCLKGDVRKVTPDKLGVFPNVLLVSVLEHIGLKAYVSSKDWENSPRAEQLQAFKHCMKFVAPGGRMLVTLPYTNKEAAKDPNFLLRYNSEMLVDLQRGYKLIDQKFFMMRTPLHLDRWQEVSEAVAGKRRSNVCFILSK